MLSRGKARNESEKRRCQRPVRFLAVVSACHPRQEKHCLVRLREISDTGPQPRPAKAVQQVKRLASSRPRPLLSSTMYVVAEIGDQHRLGTYPASRGVYTVLTVGCRPIKRRRVRANQRPGWSSPAGLDQMKKECGVEGADDLHDPRAAHELVAEKKGGGSGGVQDDGRATVCPLIARYKSNKRQRCCCCCCCCSCKSGKQGASRSRHATINRKSNNERTRVANGSRGGRRRRGSWRHTRLCPRPPWSCCCCWASWTACRAGGGGCGCGRSVVTQPSRRPSAGPSPPSPQTVEAGSRTTTHHAPPSSATQSPALPAAQAGRPGGRAHQILKDGVGGRLAAGLPQICFPPSPTLSVIDFGAWRAQDTPSQPCTRCEEGLRDPREASVSRPAEASVDEGLWRRRPRGLYLCSLSPFVLLQRPGH